MNRRPKISFLMLEARAYGGEGEIEKKEEEKKKREERKKRRKRNQVWNLHVYGMLVWNSCMGFV